MVGREHFDVPGALEQVHHCGVLNRMRADGGICADLGRLKTPVDAHTERGEQDLFPETRIDRSHRSL
jgi:hypothetical protein